MPAMTVGPVAGRGYTASAVVQDSAVAYKQAEAAIDGGPRKRTQAQGYV